MEHELDHFIGGAYKKLATFLQLLRETGMRCGEVLRLKWTEVDFKNGAITLIYTQLIQFEGDEYHSATAKNIEGARKMIEVGFEYVCTYDDIMLFRKRK